MKQKVEKRLRVRITKALDDLYCLPKAPQPDSRAGVWAWEYIYKSARQAEEEYVRRTLSLQEKIDEARKRELNAKRKIVALKWPELFQEGTQLVVTEADAGREGLSPWPPAGSVMQPISVDLSAWDPTENERPFVKCVMVSEIISVTGKSATVHCIDKWRVRQSAGVPDAGTVRMRGRCK